MVEVFVTLLPLLTHKFLKIIYYVCKNTILIYIYVKHKEQVTIWALFTAVAFPSNM